ncbi:MAG: hypothetical protein WB949_00770 [Candidatus Acidiferrales bacterium]
MADTIKRSPRLLEGTQAAALTRMFWTEPELSRVRIAKNGMSINFPFRVRVPNKVQEEPFRQYWLYFLAPPAEAFEKTLYQGYQEVLSENRRTLYRHLSNLLRKACQRAFQIWLKESWELEGYESRKDHQLKAFKQDAQIPRGPQPKPADAFRVSQLYEKYFKLVRDFRDRLKRNASYTAATVVERNLSKVIEEALRKLSKDPRSDLSLLNDKSARIGTAEIAREIVKSKMPRVDFKKVSIRKHIAFAKKLLREKLWETSVAKPLS